MDILVKKGQKVDMTKATPELERLTVHLNWKVGDLEQIDFEIDGAAFLLDATGKAAKDEDFIFYNNPCGGGNSVTHITNPANGVSEAIKINLRTMPSTIEKIAFTITMHDYEKKDQSFRQIRDISVHIFNDDTDEEVLSYNIGNPFTVETAIVAAEIYRYKGEWKFNAIGSGFNGGLAALCENFGISVEEEKQVEAPSEPKINFSKINLLKNKVKIILEKKKLIGVVSRVALVIDISRSMFSCYKEGKVQKVVDRITAVAAKFDDDGFLDMWIFDHRFHRLPPVNEDNYENYISREILEKNKQGLFDGKIFGANDEPPVMKDVINYYTQENKSKYPAFIVFISDGGIHKNKEIKQIMIDSSKYPLFWQFIGIGNANYGILEKLDIMPGRVVDNANFFSLDDVDKISDEELYNKLLNEFPMWLKEAKEKEILL